MKRLPRKRKKLFKSLSLTGWTSNRQASYNWCFNKRMVIVHNYIKAGIIISWTKEDLNFMCQGLITNPKFKNVYY